MKKAFFNLLRIALVVLLAQATLLYAESLPRLHAEGRRIVDESGNTVLLKGLCLTNNVWGAYVPGVSEKLKAQGLDVMIRPLRQDSWSLTNDDFKRLEEPGLNCVRYCFNYQLFAADNPERDANLRRLREHVERFAAAGIYTIPVLMMAPGLDTQNDLTEFPKPGPKRIKSVFEDDRFYAQWLDMWAYVATGLKDLPGVAGYEIINEPRIPCDAEGGAAIFGERMTAVCREIRKHDERRIIFVPECNSVEANPGEKYWNNNKGCLVTDGGEQGVIWKTAFAKIDLPNIVYVMHFYGDFNFTALGEGSIDEKTMAESVEARVRLADEIGKAPLICTEYGIARANSNEVRAAWLEKTHALFAKYGISATFFSYKTPVGAYIHMKRNFWSIYGEYENMRNEIVPRGDGSWDFASDDLGKMAEKNGFASIIDKYNFSKGTIARVSLVDNGPVLDELRRFWLEK